MAGFGWCAVRLLSKMVQWRLISDLAHIPIVSDVRVFQAVQEWLQQTHGLPNVLNEIQPMDDVAVGSVQVLGEMY